MEIHNPIYEDFEFEQIYYLHTKVSGNELIFRNNENFQFFLVKISKYLLPIMDIYAYCLYPKGFQLLVCFHSKTKILKNLELTDKDFNKEQEHRFLMQPISNLLNSYAKAYNKVNLRKGALFMDYIKRERIDDEEKLLSIVKKIHLLPLLKSNSKSISDWKFSSYNTYINSEKPTKINREFIMSFFKTLPNFLQFHQE